MPVKGIQNSNVLSTSILNETVQIISIHVITQRESCCSSRDSCAHIYKILEFITPSRDNVESKTRLT